MIAREVLPEMLCLTEILVEARKVGMVEMAAPPMERRGRRSSRTRSGELSKVASQRKIAMVLVCSQTTLPLDVSLHVLDSGCHHSAFWVGLGYKWTTLDDVPQRLWTDLCSYNSG